MVETGGVGGVTVMCTYKVYIKRVRGVPQCHCKQSFPSIAAHLQLHVNIHILMVVYISPTFHVGLSILYMEYNDVATINILCM